MVPTDVAGIAKKLDLIVGDVVFNASEYFVVGYASSHSRTCQCFIPIEVCDLFDDPVETYRLAAASVAISAVNLVLNMRITHPSVKQLVGHVETRWHSVTVECFSGTFYDRSTTNVVFNFSECFSSGRLDIDEVRNFGGGCHFLAKEIEPKFGVYFALDENTDDQALASFWFWEIEVPARILFEDGEIWEFADGERLFYNDFSLSECDKLVGEFRKKVGSGQVRYKFGRTARVLNTIGSVIKWEWYHNVQAASKYIHGIILDVCMCLHSIIDAPYVILWILDQDEYTKYSYSRKRENIIENIYASIRKVLRSRQAKPKTYLLSNL